MEEYVTIATRLAMPKRKLKDKEHSSWRMFLLSHLVSFQQECVKAREIFRIPPQGFPYDPTEHLANEALDPIIKHLIGLEAELSVATEKLEGEKDTLDQYLAEKVFNPFFPGFGGTRETMSFFEAWEACLFYILDLYGLPIAYLQCIEHYVFYGRINDALIRDFYVEETDTEHGRTILKVHIDHVPSQQAWKQLYISLKKRLDKENKQYGARTAIAAPRDLDLCKRIIDASAHKRVRNTEDSDQTDSEPFRFTDKEIVYEVFGVDKISQMKPYLQTIEKRRQLAKKDAAKFFPSETLDF